jgi:hypothetical protein
VIDRATASRAEAIEQFAAVLHSLRDSVGAPSFRKMSGRSHAISHTTLHEAAQGHRFPSWATTAEFVKACGADPAEYREQWERANQAVRSSAPPLAPDLGTEFVEPSEIVEDEPGPAAASQPTHHRMRYVTLGVGIGAIGVAAAMIGTLLVGTGMSRGNSPSGRFDPPSNASPSPTPLNAADCPIHQSNPPAASPAVPGDASAFIADITMPDCTHVPRSTTVIKVWRFKNVGTVPWRGYMLHRMDGPQQRDECQTISDIPIRDTEPGQLVDVKVTVTAPGSSGFCFVRFKMVDASGSIAFPGNRPVNFQILVD